jgi:Domain of unknown function (DUF4184)
MPFTVSHAAAVLPFRRLNLVWSAVVIGTMAPDFPYIIGNPDYRGIGHHFPGLIEFTIPASILALWIFHNIIKRPIAGLLPIGMQLRLQNELRPFSFGGPSRFMTILASILFGIATHLIWDSVTHSETWAYYHLRWLRGWTHVPFIGIMPVTSAMQYGSSVVGLFVLAIWIWLWYRRTPAVSSAKIAAPPKSNFALGLGMFLVAASAGLIRALVTVGEPAFRSNAHHFLLVFAVTAIALAFWQLVFYCVLVSTHQMWIIT